MAVSNKDCCNAGFDIVALASSLSILISQNASINDLNILAGFFSALGDNLSIIASARSACEANNQSSNN